MAERWKQEHRFLYNEDGSPTEDLLKLQEETKEPATDDGKTHFPIIRLSKEADDLMVRLSNAAFTVGEVPEGDRDALNAAYSRLMQVRKDLAEYLERLEYHSNIPRPKQLRFD